MFVGQGEITLQPLRKKPEVEECDDEKRCMHRNSKMFGCGLHLFPDLAILGSKWLVQCFLQYSTDPVGRGWGLNS